MLTLYIPSTCSIKPAKLLPFQHKSITLLPLLFSLRTQNSPLIYPLTLSQPLITQNIPISNLFETVQIIPQTLPSFVNFGRLMHFTTALTFANLKIILNILELIHRTQSHVKCHSYPSSLILRCCHTYTTYS